MRYKSLLAIIAAFICVPVFTYTYLKQTGYYENNTVQRQEWKKTDSIAEKSKPSEAVLTN